MTTRSVNSPSRKKAKVRKIPSHSNSSPHHPPSKEQKKVSNKKAKTPSFPRINRIRASPQNARQRPPGGALLRRRKAARAHPWQAPEESLDQPGRHHPAEPARLPGRERRRDPQVQRGRGPQSESVRRTARERQDQRDRYVCFPPRTPFPSSIPNPQTPQKPSKKKT